MGLSAGYIATVQSFHFSPKSAFGEWYTDPLKWAETPEEKNGAAALLYCSICLFAVWYV